MNVSLILNDKGFVCNTLQFVHLCSIIQVDRKLHHSYKMWSDTYIQRYLKNNMMLSKKGHQYGKFVIGQRLADTWACTS